MYGTSLRVTESGDQEQYSDDASVQAIVMMVDCFPNTPVYFSVSLRTPRVDGPEGLTGTLPFRMKGKIDDEVVRTFHVTSL